MLTARLEMCFPCYERKPATRVRLLKCQVVKRLKAEWEAIGPSRLWRLGWDSGGIVFLLSTPQWVRATRVGEKLKEEKPRARARGSRAQWAVPSPCVGKQATAWSARPPAGPSSPKWWDDLRPRSQYVSF